MTAGACPFGFRIVGGVAGTRRPVDYAAAFRAHCACDGRAEVHREAYLSAFTYGAEFRTHLDATGSTAGYAGPCWAPWLLFDIDRSDRGAALADARRLAASLLDRYRGLDDDDLLLFFSGSKGFHVGLPTTWQPEPSPVFHAVARAFCEARAAASGVRIDPAVYARVQPFRSPNSRHSKTGLHKRRLTYSELMGLSAERVAELAREPLPFDPSEPVAADERAAADWSAAERMAERAAAARAARAAPAGVPGRLQRETLDLIRGEPLDVGERHRRLFRAAANLAEFDCPPALAHELLTDPGRDCGLPPADVRRQIDCGLAHGSRPAAPPEGVGRDR
jgi:hypothetical protein